MVFQSGPDIKNTWKYTVSVKKDWFILDELKALTIALQAYLDYKEIRETQLYLWYDLPISIGYTMVAPKAPAIPTNDEQGLGIMYSIH